MKTTTVLVLGSRRSRSISDMLITQGYEPVIQHTMAEALNRVRRESFAMAVVDRHEAPVDALEFVLNVRDLNQSLPVLILGQCEEQLEYLALQQLPGVYFFHSLKSIVDSHLDK